MPEKEEILTRASYIIALKEGGTMWTGKLHGAYFEMHKPSSTLFDKEKTFIVLRLGGKRKGKQELREDFVSTLGQPLSELRSKRFNDPLSIIWDATKALKPQQRK